MPSEDVMMALNVETENTTMIASNTDTDEWWLWTPKLKMRLWMSNYGVMMALIAETENAIVMALNAKTENVMRMTLNTDTEKW